MYSELIMTEKENIKIKKQKDSTLEVEGEISGDILKRHHGRLFQEFRKNIETPGFRKGHAPEDVAKKHLNEKHLLEEAAYAALEEQYPIILEMHDIDPITPPHINITKLALGSPIGFRFVVGTKPEFSLPKYKKIAKKILEEKKDPEVSEKEVDDVVTQIQIMRAPIKDTGEKGVQETEALTDDFVKTLGAFESVEDFKNKIRENLMEEKKVEVQRAQREKIAQALVENTKISLPPMLIEEEIERVMRKIEEQMEKNSLTKEDYFLKIKKTEEDFKKEQQTYIECQYKTKFILEKIAEEESIVPTEEEIEQELAQFLAHYKDVDPDNAARYVSETIQNEKTLRFLETTNED